MAKKKAPTSVESLKHAKDTRTNYGDEVLKVYAVYVGTNHDR